jgi:hypothetical protein
MEAATAGGKAVYVNRKQFDGESNLMYRIESNRPAEGGARVELHPVPPWEWRKRQ